MLFSAVLGYCAGCLGLWLARCYVADVPSWSQAIGCPFCGTPLGRGDVLSPLALLLRKGNCRICGGAPAPRGGWLPLCCMLLGAGLAWRFGAGWPFAVYMFFGAVLLVAVFIDMEVQLLPDVITVGGALLAPFAATFGLGLTWQQSVGGAVAGAGLFWLARWCFAFLRGKEGMGLGDVKLAGLLGGLCGLNALPAIMVVGAATAFIAGVMPTKKAEHDLEGGRRIPFGPYLCLGALIYVLFGEIQEIWAAWLL